MGRAVDGEFSPPLRGGVAARSKKRREASLARADGVVSKLYKLLSNLFTTPSAPEGRVRDILLGSRPPLLEEEGTLRPSAFRQRLLALIDHIDANWLEFVQEGARLLSVEDRISSLDTEKETIICCQ